MFFLKEETKVITLHPSYFGPNVREYLINRLNEEEEGRCTGDHFVICVMDMVDIGEGRVLPSSGQAEYTIKYRAIIWKPFRGETVDAIVTSVKPTGIFTLAGPLSVFIARKNIPSDIKWEPNTVPPQYTDHADQVIEKGTSLRLKILGVKPDVAAINAIGTIKEDYLGQCLQLVICSFSDEKTISRPATMKSAAGQQTQNQAVQPGWRAEIEYGGDTDLRRYAVMGGVCQSRTKHARRQ
ncbi:RNA polymerase Rpb7 [Aspergillus pseudocaelatus]|uniref:DNA-directed RNA polymerase subunit n=1 Tax=Aspergillus pseudocaelatus TaxID=1825620 RepID=A0ABQ6WK95_9EURO|nr:RNA polymerase Rpb7 [Aspergillus pseudocaelatus]